MRIGLLLVIATFFSLCTPMQAMDRLKYNHPGLHVDLGVGLWAWPLPMDWDGDGDLDLIVSCPDKPYNGVYFFENTGDDPKLPVFKKAKRIGASLANVQVSYVNGEPRVLVGPRKLNGALHKHRDFIGRNFDKAAAVSYPSLELAEGRIRANQWKYVDFDDDGVVDLVNGTGHWGEYGWDNAFDRKGEWQRGPLHGYVHVFRNAGSNQLPKYESPYRLQAGGEDIDVYGMPSPNFADFDNDGDLDLVCGEFLDGFTYFQNVGTRTKPSYAAGEYLQYMGEKVAMHVQMITPVAIDWDKDGDVDLICGDEDGRVALVENTGQLAGGLPVFLQPVYFQQLADDLKFGALVTPVGTDWDGDGDDDLVCGNTSGNIGFIENLDGGCPPKWAAPVLLHADGRAIHIQAGENGSIQGPCEAKWGYTVLDVADWNHDGLNDLVVNSIWGEIVWYQNIGTETSPKLAAAQSLTADWAGEPPKPEWNWWNPKSDSLVTQWRTSPCVIDWNRDGLNDLVMLDHEGYLAFFERSKHGDRLSLKPGERVFAGDSYDGRHRKTERDANSAHGEILRLNSGRAGASGRRKLRLADWDDDGDLDILVNSVNVNFLSNHGDRNGKTLFKDEGKLAERTLAGHTTCPTTVDWNKDGVPDLVCGAEDGRLYYLPNPLSQSE